ncbi:MAG: winged helix DNA-binding domain-containing protein [Thermoplasmata archaeon]|nr:winged helix DNA-binding domain-containing protein [Thermoplasmata archaeon]
MGRGSIVPVSLDAVRRLGVRQQHLGGPPPPRSSPSTILALVRDLAYVQWDPVSVVAPSHLLSLWCRLPDFRPAQLERLLWTEKKLLQHWTPLASIVLTEDFPLYASLMRRYPDSLSRSWGSQRTRAKRFLADHAELRRNVLSELRSGPLRLGQFADHARTKRNDGEWTPASDVSQLLFHLQMSGQVMVVGHQGNQNLWGLPDQFLPGWVDRTELSSEDAEREAAQRAIRALGTATPREVTLYFVRGRYDTLPETLAGLEEDSTIHRVVVEGQREREPRYVHARDLSLLETVARVSWRPRLSLLPPFDNLLSNLGRTSRLFGFDYVREQFLPKEKRRFGTYVLPILWGDRLIGRIDPRLDKSRDELVIQAVHAEPGAPEDREVGAQIAATIARLAAFVGARRVTYSSRVPPPWKRSLTTQAPAE